MGSLSSQAGGLVSLDEVILENVFSVRARLMAVRFALDGVVAGWVQNDTMLQIRSWQLFLLVTRMFLLRSSRGRLLHRKPTETRVSLFARGEWAKLIEMSLDTSMNAAKNSRATPSKREHAGRYAWCMWVRSRLADRPLKERRSPRGTIPRCVNSVTRVADRPCQEECYPRTSLVSSPNRSSLYEEDRSALHSERKSSGGAAPGPSGMTADHLRLALEASVDSLPLGQVASLLSRAQVPPEIMDALGAGRLTALKKPDGGVRCNTQSADVHACKVRR